MWLGMELGLRKSLINDDNNKLNFCKLLNSIFAIFRSKLNRSLYCRCLEDPKLWFFTWFLNKFTLNSGAEPARYSQEKFLKNVSQNVAPQSLGVEFSIRRREKLLLQDNFEATVTFSHENHQNTSSATSHDSLEQFFGDCKKVRIQFYSFKAVQAYPKQTSDTENKLVHSWDVEFSFNFAK